MNHFLVFFLCFFSAVSLYGQNLVPNGDFEEEVICVEYNLNCGPFAWRLTSSEPPDYYNSPIENDTNKLNHWTSFVPFSYDNQGINREYLQVPILCPFVKGNSYSINFQIMAKEVAVKEIDVMFSPSVTVTASNRIIVSKPQVKIINENFWYDVKDKWITLSAHYIADGTEKYMMIGNFQPHLLTEHMRIYNTRKDKHLALYFIDNVFVKPDNGIFCDYSKYIAFLRADRHRHSLSPEYFFPIYPPKLKDSTFTDTTQIIIGKSIALKNVFFDVDKDELLPASFISLNNLINILTQRPELFIDIAGHTDVTGFEAHNEKLSENRAVAVANYLISNGINSKRISTKGFASTRPVAKNDSPEGRQANRRVEFTLHENTK